LRDVLEIVGVGSIVYGLWQIWEPLAWIGAGSVVVAACEVRG
jgi:hypothetical protein